MLLPQRKLFPFPARRPARFYAYTKIYSTAEYLLDNKIFSKKKNPCHFTSVFLMKSPAWQYFPTIYPLQKQNWRLKLKNNLFMD